MSLVPFNCVGAGSSLVPRAATDDQNSVKAVMKKVFTYDFMKDIFPRVGRVTTYLQFNAEVSSQSGKVLRSLNIMKTGLSYFAWREKTCSIMCSLTVSWVGALGGKYIPQITSTLCACEALPSLPTPHQPTSASPLSRRIAFRGRESFSDKIRKRVVRGRGGEVEGSDEGY